MKRVLAGLLLTAAMVLPAQAALAPGAPAPDFATKAALGGKEFDFSLKTALKKGPVVLFFFPAAKTAGCTIEAKAFADASDEFNKNGATVIGITAGNLDQVVAFSAEECRNKFAVAMDPGGKIAKAYDSVLARRPEWSDRISYVISPDNKVIYTYSNLKPDGHVDNTMAAVKAWNNAHPKKKS